MAAFGVQRTTTLDFSDIGWYDYFIIFRGILFIVDFFSAFADDDTDSVATPIGFKRRKLEANLRVQTGPFSDDEDADEFSPSRRFLNCTENRDLNIYIFKFKKMKIIKKKHSVSEETWCPF